MRNYRWMDIRKLIPVTYRTSALWGRCPKSEKDFRCMFNRETGKHQCLEIKNQRDLIVHFIEIFSILYPLALEGENMALLSNCLAWNQVHTSLKTPSFDWIQKV